MQDELWAVKLGKEVKKNYILESLVCYETF